MCTTISRRLTYTLAVGFILLIPSCATPRLISVMDRENKELRKENQKKQEALVNALKESEQLAKELNTHRFNSQAHQQDANQCSAQLAVRERDVDRLVSEKTSLEEQLHQTERNYDRLQRSYDEIRSLLTKTLLEIGSRRDFPEDADLLNSIDASEVSQVLSDLKDQLVRERARKSIQIWNSRTQNRRTERLPPSPNTGNEIADGETREDSYSEPKSIQQKAAQDVSGFTTTQIIALIFALFAVSGALGIGAFLLLRQRSTSAAPRSAAQELAPDDDETAEAPAPVLETTYDASGDDEEDCAVTGVDETDLEFESEQQQTARAAESTAAKDEKVEPLAWMSDDAPVQRQSGTEESRAKEVASDELIEPHRRSATVSTVPVRPKANHLAPQNPPEPVTSASKQRASATAEVTPPKKRVEAKPPTSLPTQAREDSFAETAVIGVVGEALFAPATPEDVAPKSPARTPPTPERRPQPDEPEAQPVDDFSDTAVLEPLGQTKDDTREIALPAENNSLDTQVVAELDDSSDFGSTQVIDADADFGLENEDLHERDPDDAEETGETQVLTELESIMEESEEPTF